MSKPDMNTLVNAVTGKTLEDTEKMIACMMNEGADMVITHAGITGLDQVLCWIVQGDEVLDVWMTYSTEAKAWSWGTYMYLDGYEEIDEPTPWDVSTDRSAA